MCVNVQTGSIWRPLKTFPSPVARSYIRRLKIPSSRILEKLQLELDWCISQNVELGKSVGREVRLMDLPSKLVRILVVFKKNFSICELNKF